MNRRIKFSKWTVIVIAILVLAYFSFDILVLEPHASGSTTLSWSAPTEDEDNDPLNDLVGYIVHCWSDAEQYSNKFLIDDPATTSFEISDLTPGDYYCAITAVSDGGRESALSNIVAKHVQ